MKIYVNNVRDIEMESEITERELLVLVQAARRKIMDGRISVVFNGNRRMLDIDAIDVSRTLPRVVFSEAS